MSAHIILFLKENLNINFVTLVDKLNNSYKELGNGILIEKKYNNPNQPNFIFNNNKEVQIDGNNHHISINLFNDYVKIKDDIIGMLWDAFDYCDLEFKRIGYIIEKNIEVENIDYIKKQLLNPNVGLISDEFQVAYHSIIKFKRKNINCWKRFIKFYNSPLIISYDINTKEDNISDINYKLLCEFLKFSDRYVIEDIELFIKE